MDAVAIWRELRRLPCYVDFVTPGLEETDGNQFVDLIVFCKENACRPASFSETVGGFGAGHMIRWPVSDFGTDGEMKSAALANFAFQPNMAVHHLHEPGADRQSESGPSIAPRY
jgi:hypothetical protein